jgi:two-component system C4-dicarboxylate transport sensor histidine kinase DctB
MNLIGKPVGMPLLRHRHLMLILGCGAVLVAAMTLPLIERTMRASALDEAQRAASNEAAILAAGLESELDKFSLVPLVLARDPQVQSLLRGNLAEQAALNQRLEQLARQTGAAAIYLMDREGLTLAASNWNRPDSFVGSTYRFRDYFRKGLADGVASQFALGTVSRRPGLFITRRVDGPSGAIGVVAIKVEFDKLEANWAKTTSGVYACDPSGVILVTSRPAWRFRKMQPGAAGEPGHNGRTSALIDSRHPVAPFDWELHLLSDPSPALAAAKANARLLFFVLLVLIIAAIAAVVVGIRRREARAERMLNERTARLRDQLQQANRLATLGQITAGVGHEIRQPVSAIRILAETGVRLGERGAHDEARENFARITALTDRIGTITDELRRFSRRGDRARRDVALRQLIDGALLLLRDRISHLGIHLVLPPDAALERVVRGEHVGLEQVLVNLLQNAIDATGQSGQVTIAVDALEREVRLSVTDDGPGISAEQRANLFQPFATTKAEGLGLGLVISQDIMRGLGGDLVAEEVPTGARFTMVIPCP